FFFSTDPHPSEIYTLSLHDALPIYARSPRRSSPGGSGLPGCARALRVGRPYPPADAGVGPGPPETLAGPPGDPRLHFCPPGPIRSEEHTSELQSQSNLVCRLLLEKK